MTFILSVLLVPLVLSEISSEEVNLLSQFKESNAKFATKLYSAVIESKTDANVVVSPLSVQICGSLLYSGAAGITAEEMAKGLSLFQNNISAVTSAFQEVIHSHKSDDLQLANKIYVGKDVQVKEDFHKTATNDYFSDTENVDFAKSEETAELINRWVQDATHDKIRDLFKKSDFDETVKLALVNTIYFKEKWKLPFESTRQNEFWLSENESEEIEMMTLLNEDTKFAKLDKLDARAVQLDYENTDASMLIILPNERTGLKKLEERLSEIDLIGLRDEMNEAYIDLELPVFHIDTSADLKDTFTKMGMGAIFESQADFSNMVENFKVKVDKAVHKAFIDVTQVGTEAGAAAGFSAHWVTIPQRFTADHPFFFAIVSKSAVLFVGRFVK